MKPTLAELLEPVPDGAIQAVEYNGEKITPTYSKGWEPRVETGDTDGQATSQATLDGNADEATLIAGWGLDPEAWEIIDGTLRVNKRQQNSVKAGMVWLHQYRANLRKRTGAIMGTDPDLARIITHWKSRKKPRDGDHAFVVNLADWQAGKGEGGGSEALLNRILSSIDATEAQLLRVRKSTNVGHIVMVGMGDLIEQCSGNYPSQAFTTDLTRREQMRLARRCIAAFVSRLAPQAERVTVATVGGNHGENRGQAGKAFTDPGDNDDVAVFESIAESFLHRKDYEHVEWVIPVTERSILLDCAGTPIGFTHGDQARTGASPAVKQVNWWKGQTMGGVTVAPARVLVTAHYHHLIAQETHGKIHLQCPSLDGGSRWYTDSTGDHSHPGTLTFVTGPTGDVTNLEVVA